MRAGSESRRAAPGGFPPLRGFAPQTPQLVRTFAPELPETLVAAAVEPVDAVPHGVLLVVVLVIVLRAEERGRGQDGCHDRLRERLGALDLRLRLQRLSLLLLALVEDRGAVLLAHVA